MEFLTSKEERTACSIRRHKCSDFHLHLHENIEILYVICGSGKVKISGTEYSYETGDAIVVFPYEIHEYYGANENEEAICIAINPTRLSFDFQTVGLRCKIPKIKHGALTDRAEIILKMLLDENNGNYKRQNDNFLSCALFGELIGSCTLIPGFGIESCCAESILKTCVENYKNNSFNISELSKKCGINIRSISKFFSEQIGTSFPKFITSLRLSHAFGLLKQKEMRITEAALESGFGSVRSFNRVFKEEYGKSPREHL